jgi:NAD(P)-dependent dehydrogenase (short-subunit alcohol dehydrogenase family)
MHDLKDKGAVVTGAASGIGKAIATAFTEAGASVLLCDLNAKGLDAAARDLGNRALGRVTDVSDESQVEGAMRTARDAFGSLDIVVNCAGFGVIAPGLVDTPLTKKELQNPAMREVFMDVIPLKRAVEAKQIADAAVFLASDDARSINGHTIVIDGGSLTRGYPALLTGLKKAA